jgi:tetratricopeptide (TPR) repeat protein
MTGDVPARQINVGGEGGSLVAAEDGELHVHRRIGTHLIDELSFRARPAAGDEQPSRLLNAGNRVVRFTGREKEIADLTAWRDIGGAVAVRLVHGGAGQGKTRLAHRFAELSQAGGWVALRARHSRDVSVRPIEVGARKSLVAAGPILVVVDYAERWPLSDLLALLLDRRLHGGPALRVLMLARPVGNWWHALTHGLSKALGVRADNVEIAPLGATQGDSARAFEVARACFAEALGVRDPGGPSPEVEGSVLTIHMAALAYVLAVRRGDTPPTDPAQLSAYLLSRERSHWQSMYDNDRRVSSAPEVMGRVVYVAALARALDRDSAAGVLTSTSVADGVAGAARVIDDHAMCYPPHDPATVLEPLYPDRLAEDFVALQSPGHTIDGFRPDPWAGDALEVLVDNNPRIVTTMFPLLVEAARRWPHLAHDHLLPLLRRRPELAIHAGSPALSALAAAQVVPLDLLAAIDSALPDHPPADLRAGVAAITERLAAGLRGQTDDPARMAAVYLKLGWRLFDSGRISDGIGMLATAVSTTRRLADRDPAAYASQLEFALRGLGRAHLQAGDWESAAAELGEAVSMWSAEGMRVSPSAGDAAGCLSDLSLALWNLGRDGASLSTRHRAIGRLRRLALIDPRHRLALVRALVQQAEQLRRGDRPGDALDALNEVAELLREVAGVADVGFEADVAAALLGRAKTLHSLGGLDEAVFAAAGAVEAFQRLAHVNVSYDQDLARALGVEAEILAGLQRWPDALESQHRAISIGRRLLRINPDRYGLDLIRALIAFARFCRDAGRRRVEAVEALREAVGVLQTGRYEPTVVRRLLRAAHSIGADLLDVPAPSRPSRPPPRSDMDHAAEAKAVLRREPYLARLYLEKLAVRDIALVLLAMTPKYFWLQQVFLGFRPLDAAEILQQLVRYEIDEPVMRKFVAKQLLARPYEVAAAILRHANPATAADILNYEPGFNAEHVLAFLDPALADEITRLLDHDRKNP